MKRRSHKRRGTSIPPFFFSGAALAAAVTVLLALRFSLPWLVSYLAGINASTFTFYGYDKIASRRNLSRVSEKTLHILAFAGGTPGAFLAQGIFRHKTAKGSFRRIFWLLAAAQVAIIAWALWYFRG